MRLYTDLAPWYPLLTPPSDYVEEAEDVLATFVEELGGKPAHLLELGSGAGHLAFHLGVPLTLVDASPEMLALSRRVNPDAEHVEGDMRTVRLGRTFPAVLVHDAIMYMTTREDLVAALRTARVHLEPGGLALVVPDCVAETFEPGTDSGGSDGEDGRAVRYLEWSHALAPGESTCVVDYVLVCTEGDRVQLEHDRHVEGVFPIAVWHAAFREAGFTSVEVTADRFREVIFVARA